MAPAKNRNQTKSNGSDGKVVDVTLDEGIAWVAMNRPEKRNAMNPALNDEMLKVLDGLEVDDACGVVVLTGVGDSFSAGMDLKEYFRDVDGLPFTQQVHKRRSAWQWQWRQLMAYPKPTIAMVNGWCFGGAFTPLVACDLAIAAEDATFGLSEINWGIIPGGNVTRSVVAAMNLRDAMYYIMTGETFDGRKAAAMGLVNEAVPKKRLRERTRELAKVLLGKNPTVLRAAKTAVRGVQGMPWELSDDYLMAKSHQSRYLDPEQGRAQGLKQFLDEKSFKPGLAPMRREGKRS
jgi:feruloyl-CoA hydratase/lyase